VLCFKRFRTSRQNAYLFVEVRHIARKSYNKGVSSNLGTALIRNWSPPEDIWAMTKNAILTTVVLFAWFATALSGALQLLQPLPGATYYILPGLRTATIPVNYRFDAVSVADYSATFCLVVSSLTSNQQFSENCFDVQHTSLNLNDISEGSYRVTVYLREQTVAESSIQSVGFVVKQAPPPGLTVIQAGKESGDILGVADPATNLAAISLELRWNGVSDAVLSAYEVCISLTQQSQNSVTLPSTCFAQTDTTISLSRLPIGLYNLQSVLRPKVSTAAAADGVINTNYALRVVPLNEAYPSLLLPEGGASSHAATRDSSGGHSYKLEYVAGTASRAANADIAVQIFSADTSVVAMVVPCLELSNSEDNSVLAPTTCLEPSQHTFSIRALPVGVYTARLSLRPAYYAQGATPPPDYAEAVAKGTISAAMEVRVPEEFVPAYEWQLLGPWHTVPTGLEIRYQHLKLFQ
jgi:hypothetical protein